MFEFLTNDIVSFEQADPDVRTQAFIFRSLVNMYIVLACIFSHNIPTSLIRSVPAERLLRMHVSMVAYFCHEIAR